MILRFAGEVIHQAGTPLHPESAMQLTAADVPIHQHGLVAGLREREGEVRHDKGLPVARSGAGDGQDDG